MPALRSGCRAVDGDTRRSAGAARQSSGRISDSKLQTWFETTIECFIDLVEASKHYPHLKKQWVEFLGERPDEVTTRVELGETAAV